jgi:hypothetical protein
MQQSLSWEANRFAASQDIPHILWNPRLISAFASARHLSLSWTSSIQSKPPHPTSWKSALVVSSHLRLGLHSGLFSSGFPTKTMYTTLLSPLSYMSRPSHYSKFYHPPSRGWGVQIMELLIVFSHTSVTSSLLGPNILLTPLACDPPSMTATKFHTHTKQQQSYVSVYINL